MSRTRNFFSERVVSLTQQLEQQILNLQNNIIPDLEHAIEVNEEQNEVARIATVALENSLSQAKQTFLENITVLENLVQQQGVDLRNNYSYRELLRRSYVLGENIHQKEQQVAKEKLQYCRILQDIANQKLVLNAKKAELANLLQQHDNIAHRNTDFVRIIGTLAQGI